MSLFLLQSSCFFSSFLHNLIWNSRPGSGTHEIVDTLASICHVTCSSPLFHSQLHVSNVLQVLSSFLIFDHNCLKIWLIEGFVIIIIPLGAFFFCKNPKLSFSNNILAKALETEWYTLRIVFWVSSSPYASRSCPSSCSSRLCARIRLPCSMHGCVFALLFFWRNFSTSFARWKQLE